MEVFVIVARMVLTFAAAGLFGLERQWAHKPIGFGTFIFVATGACSLAITALLLVPENPLPLLSAIVTGIGFLGAGAMIKTSDKIFGVTTAASIWLFAIFGLLIGIGEVVTSLCIYVAVWAVAFIDLELQRKGVGSYQRKLSITAKEAMSEDVVRDALKAVIKNFKLLELSVEIGKSSSFVYVVEGKKENIDRLPIILSKEPWLEKAAIN